MQHCIHNNESLKFLNFSENQMMNAIRSVVELQVRVV